MIIPWHDEAKCAELSLDDIAKFFPEQHDAAATQFALDVCNGRQDGVVCPVIEQCREHAMNPAAPEKHGIWGGMTSTERERYRRKGRGNAQETQDRLRGARRQPLDPSSVVRPIVSGQAQLDHTHPEPATQQLADRRRQPEPPSGAVQTAPRPVALPRTSEPKQHARSTGTRPTADTRLVPLRWLNPRAVNAYSQQVQPQRRTLHLYRALRIWPQPVSVQSHWVRRIRMRGALSASLTLLASTRRSSRLSRRFTLQRESERDSSSTTGS